jgi:uncharacterized protein YeaO (DUF488 family)
MLKVYTSRITYNGPNKLDITVKNQDNIGRIFAPTWDIVTYYKEGVISEEQYTNKYHKMMLKSYDINHHMWEEILSRKRVVFCCFCPANAFCHRFILAGYFESLGAVYCGEICYKDSSISTSNVYNLKHGYLF